MKGEGLKDWGIKGRTCGNRRDLGLELIKRESDKGLEEPRGT